MEELKGKLPSSEGTGLKWRRLDEIERFAALSSEDSWRRKRRGKDAAHVEGLELEPARVLEGS